MFFRAVHCMRQITRTPSLSRNIWFRTPVDAYRPGNRLSLVLPEGRVAEVKIVKAFTPFTNSVALLVDSHTNGHGYSTGLPDRFLLKLADRRVYPEWNIEGEKEYQSNLQSHISKFGVSFELDRRDMLPWMYLLDGWHTHNFGHFREREAYKRLIEAQESGSIPRFYGTAKLAMMSTALHPSLSYIKCLLIEYIPGRSMASTRPGITITLEEAESISQRVLELGRRLRRYGVRHSDVHVGNIILQARDNSPVLIDWGSASFNAADLPLQERWNDYNIHADFHKDIRRLLRRGVYYEGPDDDLIYPAFSAGGVWHRFRTPLTNEEQTRIAREMGYRWVNEDIAALSEEEKALFYDEDTSVDVDRGLRWKVREGVKTRLEDDPVPVE